MYILNLLIWENCTYCKYLMNIWRIGEVPDQVDYTKSGKIQYHSSTYKGMYNCLAICDILITLQEMCCGFLLSREMCYRKSVLPGTGAG